MQSADGALIGPFNPLLESPEISASFWWDYQAAEERRTTLSGRERQVVILAVGAVWHAPYELYSHSAAARTAGLSPEQVGTLAGGGMPARNAVASRCGMGTSARPLGQALLLRPVVMLGGGWLVLG